MLIPRIDVNLATRLKVLMAIVAFSGWALVPVQSALADHVSGLNILFIPSGEPDPGDQVIIDRLTSPAGGAHVVTVMDDDAVLPTDALGRHLIIISDDVSSGDITSKFAPLAVPVIVYEGSNYDNFRFTPRSSNGDTDLATELTITGAGHPISLGFAPGPVVTHTSPQNIKHVDPTVLAPGATVIATVDVDGDQRAALFAVDKGGELLNGFKAPARRVGFFWDDTAVDQTPAALHLLDNTVQWAISHDPYAPAYMEVIQDLDSVATQGVGSRDNPGVIRVERYVDGAQVFSVQESSLIDEGIFLPEDSTIYASGLALPRTGNDLFDSGEQSVPNTGAFGGKFGGPDETVTWTHVIQDMDLSTLISVQLIIDGADFEDRGDFGAGDGPDDFGFTVLLNGLDVDGPGGIDTVPPTPGSSNGDGILFERTFVLGDPILDSLMASGTLDVSLTQLFPDVNNHTIYRSTLIAEVPEPATIGLVLLGCGGLLRRRRTR